MEVVPQHIDALDLLPGVYEDWAIVERERIRQRMLHALEMLSHRLVSVGRYADAIEAALTAVSADPLRESAQRALIEAHAAEDNWGEARRSFECFRTLIRREPGSVRRGTSLPSSPRGPALASTVARTGVGSLV